MSSEKQKCFDILGLSPTADEDEIKRAYRKLALQYHPDKNNNADAKSKFQQISYAYKYLTEGPDNNEDHHDAGQFFEQMFRDMFFQSMFHGHSRFSPFCFYFDSDDDDDDFYIYCSESDDEPYYRNRSSSGWFNKSHPTYRNPDKDVPSDPKVNKKKLRRQMKNKRQRERQKEKRKEKDSSSKTKPPQPSKEEQTDNQTKLTKESNYSDKKSGTKASSVKEETTENPSEKKSKEKRKEEEREKRRIEKEAKETVANMLRKQKEKDEREKEKQRLKKEKEEEKDDISDWFFDDVHKSKKSKQKEKKHWAKGNQGYKQNSSGSQNIPKGSRKKDNPLAELNINRNNSSQPENKASSDSDQFSSNMKNNMKPNGSNPADKRYKNRFDIMADQENFDNIINGLNIDSDNGDDDDNDDESDESESDQSDNDEIPPNDQHNSRNGTHVRPQSGKYQSKQGNIRERKVHVKERNCSSESSRYNSKDYHGKIGKTSNQYKLTKPMVFTNTKFKDDVKQDNFGSKMSDNIPSNQPGCTSDRMSAEKTPNTKPVFNRDVKAKDYPNRNGYNQRADAQPSQHSRAQNGMDANKQFVKNGQFNGEKSNIHKVNEDLVNHNKQHGPNKNDHQNRNYGPKHSDPHGSYDYNGWNKDPYNTYQWEHHYGHDYRGHYGEYPGPHGNFRDHGEFRGHFHGWNHGGELRGYKGQQNGYRGMHDGFRGHFNDFRGHHGAFRGHYDSFRYHHNGYGAEQNGFRENRGRGKRGFRGGGFRGHHHSSGFQTQGHYNHPHDKCYPNTSQNKGYQQSHEFTNGYKLYPDVGDNLSDSVSSLESLEDDQSTIIRRDSIDSISDCINQCSNHNPSNTRNSRNNDNRLTNDKLGIPYDLFLNDRIKNYYK